MLPIKIDEIVLTLKQRISSNANIFSIASSVQNEYIVYICFLICEGVIGQTKKHCNLNIVLDENNLIKSIHVNVLRYEEHSRLVDKIGWEDVPIWRKIQSFEDNINFEKVIALVVE